MSAGLKSELCRVQTDDGLPLEGIFIPAAGPAADHPVSALLLVHGTGSNFYAGGVLERFSEQAARAGLAVLRINTRGHDLVTRISGRNFGAAYETISDCRRDLAAWLGFLADRGHASIGLVGHSMGAVKAIYAQSLDRHPSVRCVAGISPPRFCHARLIEHPACDAFREDFRRASELVAQGKPQQLMTVTQPLPLLLTAEGFLAKYGLHDDYDYVKYLPRLPCPSLILIGSESVQRSPAFAGVPDDLARLLVEHPELPVTFDVIEGVDTAYSKHPDEPFLHVNRWLKIFREINFRV